MTRASRSWVLSPESSVPGGETQDLGLRTRDPLGDIPADEGCDLAPSCLGCPFPRCRYDDPGLVRRLRHGTRRQEQARRLAALSAEGGWTMAEAAGRLGVSRRTAFRVRRLTEEVQR